MTDKSDRVVSFSIKPTDSDSIENTKKLKAHCKRTGMSFSFYICKAIAQINKELKLK